MHLKQRKISRIVIFLLIMVLCLTGCQTGKNPSESEKEGTESNVEGNEANTENQDTEEGHTLAGTSPVFDRSVTEGEMAVYYMAADAIYEYDGTTQWYGDSTLVIAPDGTTMLIDIMHPAATAEIVETLKALGIDTIDYLVFSHQHSDHIGGYMTLFRYMDVKQVYCNDFDYTSSYIWRGVLSEIEKRQIPVTYLYEGDNFSFGGIDVEVFHPYKGYEHNSSGDVMNNGSIVMKMTYGESTFMFGGDIQTEVEPELVKEYGDRLQADICKTNHHGNENANSKEWIQTVAPKLAITEMSVIQSDRIMGRYAVAGATTLCTGINGTIAVWTSGDGEYDVQVQDDMWATYTNLPEEVEDGHFVIK